MQRDLVGQIAIHNRKASEAYKGFLHIVYGRRHPGWASFTAYAMRDTLDILARTGQGEGDMGRPLRVGERRRMLAGVLDRSTGQEYGNGQAYRMLAGMHGALSGIAHSSSPVPAEDLITATSQAEGILHMLSAPQTKVNEAVDGIMSGDPSAEGARRLIAMITTGATQKHVLEKLPPGWLHHMADAGFFRDPKKGEHWVTHGYLPRCVGYDPDGVAEIILKYDIRAVSENRLLYIDMLEIALRLPIKHASTVARRVLDGPYEQFTYDPERYFGMVTRLYLGGMRDLATGLLRRALSSLDDPGVHDDVREDVRRELEKAVKDLGGADLLPLVAAMADLLDGYIRADGLDPGMFDENPFVAGPGDGAPHSVKTSLVTQIRDCLAVIGESGQDLRKALEIIGGREHLVWRRVEMHTYSKFRGYEKEMADLATKYLWDESMEHECLGVLGRLSGIGDGAKREIQEAIMRGPEGGSGDRTALEARRFRRMDAISDWLDDRYLGEYIRLSKRYGRPRPRARREHGLADKDMDEVFEIVGQYKPELPYMRDRILGEFLDRVRDRPHRASGMAGRIKDARPEVQTRFFEGMEDALLKGVRIRWDAVMPLVRHVVSGFPGPAEGHDAVTAACRMMRTLMRKGQDAGPRDQIWEVASGLAGGGTGGPKAFEPDDDVFDSSLGDIGALSFQIMALCITWDTGDGLAPKAREFIDGYAGDPGSHTAYRNAVLGAYMRDLYKADWKWALRIAESARGGPCGAAFWNGYVMTNQADPILFTDLAGWHDEFLNGRGDLRGSRMHASTFSHVLVACLHGVEGAGDIFERFLGSVNREESGLVDRCAYEVEMAAEVWGGPGIDWGVIEPLWTHPAFLEADLSGWFMGGRMDRRTVITEYARHVEERARIHAASFNMTELLVEKIGSYVAEFPLVAAEILERMTDNPKGGYVPPNVHGVLDRLKRAGDRVIEASRAAREKAAAMGCEPP